MSAWKVAKQHFKLVGKPLKDKVISRAVAYPGTPHGALAITGLPNMKKDFEPLAPGGFRLPNTLASLDLMERERLNDRVLQNEAALGATLGRLLDLEGPAPPTGPAGEPGRWRTGAD